MRRGHVQIDNGRRKGYFPRNDPLALWCKTSWHPTLRMPVRDCLTQPYGSGSGHSIDFFEMINTYSYSASRGIFMVAVVVTRLEIFFRQLFAVNNCGSKF